MPVYRVYPKRKKNIFSGMSVNTILILINVVAFIVFLIMLNYGFSIDSVALKPANVFEGKYLWTFFTSMFMHGGLAHIFVNMLSLFFLGILTEKILGSKRYFWFYIVSGLVAGVFFVLLSLIFSADYNAYAVGASGAIFGIAGLLMFLTPNLPVYLMFIPIPIKMKYAAPGLLIVLWLISAFAGAGIGNTAHLGGLIAGIIYGVYLRQKFPNKTKAISRHFS